MLELDEEDYELLGWGAQKAKETLAKEISRAVAKKRDYNREYMRWWRQMKPDKAREIKQRYRQSDKGKATTKAYRLKIREKHLKYMKEYHKKNKIKKHKKRGRKTKQQKYNHWYYENVTKKKRQQKLATKPTKS